MNKTQLKQAAIDSVNFIVADDPSLGLDSRLERFGSSPDSEWLDTAADFSPGVLNLYPDIPPCPDAEAYGVGYGELVACKHDGTRFKQFAVWYGADEGWKLS